MGKASKFQEKMQSGMTFEQYFHINVLHQNQTGGPVKLIAPDFASNYQVDRVAEIHSEPRAVSIAGDVANPLVITGKNLTDFQSQTLRGEFKPGDEPNRTSEIGDITYCLAASYR